MVSELDGVVVGYLIGYRAEHPSVGEEFDWFRARLASFLYIDQVAVVPALRRAHVATRLYEHATATAWAHGIPFLACEVNLAPLNLGSLAFHRGLGFEDVGVLSTQDHRTVSLMRKPIIAEE